LVLGLKPAIVLSGLCAAGFLCCVPMAMPQGHLVAFCSDVGIPASQGAAMLSVLLGCAFVSRQFWGYVADRIGGLQTILAGSACQITAMIGFLLTRLFALEEMRTLSSYLQEVAKAYSAHDEAALDDLILADLTYADARRARGAVIDFSRSSDNLSVRAANSFAALLREPHVLSPSDRVHLYVEYMDRIRDRLLRQA
jgi:hypothetical protein